MCCGVSTTTSCDDGVPFHLLWRWEALRKKSDVGQFTQQHHFRLIFLLFSFCSGIFLCWESDFFAHLSLVIIYYVSSNEFFMRNGNNNHHAPKTQSNNNHTAISRPASTMLRRHKSIETFTMSEIMLTIRQSSNENFLKYFGLYRLSTSIMRWCGLRCRPHTVCFSQFKSHHDELTMQFWMKHEKLFVLFDNN